MDCLIFRGSAISRIVGGNVKENAGFNHCVKMWVFEEMIDGRKLTEIINETHENVKYLKGFTIPDNVVSLLAAVNIVCEYKHVQPGSIVLRGGSLIFLPLTADCVLN